MSYSRKTSFLDDVFAIDEVTMYDGDNHSDKCYAVAGDILDGYLYDLFMDMLGRHLKHVMLSSRVNTSGIALNLWFYDFSLKSVTVIC